MTVRSSIGGRSARIRLSNAYGTGPLSIGAACIALHDKESAIVMKTNRVLTFSGKSSFVIPSGALIVSDPVDLDVPTLGVLTISVYVTGAPNSPSIHLIGLRTTYITKPGDFTRAKTLPDATTTES
jgi:hypothetical protein